MKINYHWDWPNALLCINLYFQNTIHTPISTTDPIDADFEIGQVTIDISASRIVVQRKYL